MLFSIIIPCYNHAHFLEDSISSLISQAYTNWEAIIVNDGSTDNTDYIANNWCKKDSRIKFISCFNKGLSAARNIGIEFSSGDIISLLDADDRYEVNHLQLLFNKFSQGYDIVFTGYSYFSDSDNIHYQIRLNNSIKFDEILHGNIIPPVAVSFNRSKLMSTGDFDISLNSAEDWDLWIRFFKVGCSLGISDEPSALYRISANSMSRQFLTMYEALKIVSFQAYRIDSRISSDYPFNKNIVFSNFDSIKKHLLLCIGVAILQNKKTMAINLFRKEMDLYDFKFTSIDFRYFCSYLSFRYQFSKNGLNLVLNNLYPKYLEFFQELNLPGLDIKEAMNEVFSIHLKQQIKYKWGFLSPIINFLS